MHSIEYFHFWMKQLLTEIFCFEMLFLPSKIFYLCPLSFVSDWILNESRPKRLKSERGAAKYKNIWLLGNGLCFENKLQKETFYCFPLLGISKAAARRYSCLSPVLGKSSCLKSGWTTSFSQNFQLPFLIFPKPENKLYTKERFWDWKLTSCNVTFKRSQQRAL